MDIIISNLGKAEQFTLLFQHIRLFSEHVNITFDKHQMYMQSMDSSRVSVFELTLPATWFDEYNHTSETPITIGVSSSLLFKILNTREKIQEINIKFKDEESDQLFIYFTCNTSAVFNKRFELPLIDLDCELMEIPEITSNAEFSINSTTYANLINQLKIFGDTIEIECSEEKIVLHAISTETGKMLVDINIDDLTEYSINEGEIIKLSFSLNMLHNICMYNKISKEIDIFLTKDYPMKVIYKLGEDNANFTFYLAPKIGDDDD
jgi:proliferating cell nuclear antigen PCNA